MTAAVVSTTNRPISRLSSASMRSCSRLAASLALGHNLLGGSDCFLRLLFLNAPAAARASSINSAASEHHLFEHFPLLGFGPGQFGLDLLGVRQTFGNPLATLVSMARTGR